jgi:hypothetical protein
MSSPLKAITLPSVRSLLAGALLLLAPASLLAHDEKPKSGHGEHAHDPQAGYDTAAAAWAAISQAASQLESLVGAEQLDGVHDQTDRLLGALKALGEKTTDLNADKKKRLDAAVRQAGAITDNLHEAADGAEQKKAEAELKKLKSALKLVEAQLPPEILREAKEHAEHAKPGHAEHEHGEHAHAHGAAPATIATRFLPEHPLNAGVETPVVIRLTDQSGRPVSAADLVVAHTKRVHLLIVDASLTDYQHIHPDEVPGRPGDWAFNFKPRAGGAYKLFADLLPQSTGAQEYSVAEFTVNGATRELAPTLNNVAEVDGYRFELAFEDGAPLVAGQAALVKVRVFNSDGQPFNALEPLMGAFAHGVGFTADRRGVLHVHPLGREPEQDHERGGPEMSFHLLPERAGFLKFFVQVQIGGRDYFAGYGLDVQSASTIATHAASQPEKKG